MDWKKYLREDEIYNLDSGENVECRNIEITHLSEGFANKIDKTILDVGGSTEIDNFLRENGFKVTALSLMKSDNMIKSDMHEMPFKNEEFKTVLCSHTIEHSLSPYILLCEINRVLEKDGYLFLIFPEEGDFWTFGGHHYYCLTVRQIWSLLLKTGFKILKTSRFKFSYGSTHTKIDLGLLCIKQKGWKHDLKSNVNLIPFNGEYIVHKKYVLIQDIFYMRNENKIKNTYMS